MTLLIFGQTGQISKELQRLAPEVTYLGECRADLMELIVCTIARSVPGELNLCP